MSIKGPQDSSRVDVEHLVNDDGQRIVSFGSSQRLYTLFSKAGLNEINSQLRTYLNQARVVSRYHKLSIPSNTSAPCDILKSRDSLGNFLRSRCIYLNSSSSSYRVPMRF